MENLENRQIWTRLGLDLVAHDGLLSILGKAYSDIYLAQKDRPEGMKYLDFVLSEVHGLRIKELFEAKDNGRKVIGSFCIFVPEEIILAADAVSVGLCAGAEAGFEEAERFVPRNTCALIKAFIGFKMAHLCPYVESTDLIVGETTCDGKKKAYELLGQTTPVYVMEIPHMKEAADRALWRSEVVRFLAKVEALTGRQLGAEDLRRGIRLVNAKKRALQRLNRLRAADPSPISGLDALLIHQVSFYDDPVRFTAQVDALCEELERRVAEKSGLGKGKRRILVSGSPMAVPNWKLPFLVEGAGAVIVGEESCVGERNIRDLTDDSAGTRDGLIDAIVDRAMKINCACFTPNHGRLDDIVRMAGELKADGVIHYALSFCAPYTFETRKVEDRLGKEGIPLLKVETDYSMEDAGQLKTRVEAFLETLG